ncbi:unnamed protein product [Paramecium primaurelia]|uniref:Signal recognition particle 9 kDa protein n=1 Tax=Paramecium primaurelia TaxID=5886 RepID=A0A8S1KHM2_PARPR|nr:unnamed protein product [Paramecium primaurelia]
MLKSWDLFMTSALDLLMESPQARAKVKYYKIKQLALLTVTDDKKHFIFKSRNVDEIEQFIKLTSKLMLNVDPTEVKEEPQEPKTDKKQSKKKGKGNKK